MSHAADRFYADPLELFDCRTRTSSRFVTLLHVGAGALIVKDTVEKGVYLAERGRLFEKSSDEVEP